MIKTKVSEAVRLRDTELDLYRRRKLLATELAADQGKMVAALAAGGPLTALTSGTNQAGLETVDEAIAAVRRARPKAIREEFESRANSLRLQAQGLRASRQRIIEATAPLLMQLSKLEELKFDRGILHAQRTGRFFPIGGLGSEFAIEDRNPMDAAGDIGASFGVPRSHALLRQAVALERQAVDLEERELQRSGNAEGITLQALIVDAYADETRLAPTPSEIESWADSFEVQFKGRYCASVSLQPKRFHLIWRNGLIDSASFIEYEAATREAA